MKHYGSTVAAVFDFDGISISETRKTLVKSVVKLRVESLARGECVADDILLFVKDEPHKLSKLQQGRLRLISGVSLVDAIVDRMLFGELADSVSSSVWETPILIGWNPLVSGAKFLAGSFPNGSVSIDKSCWDWSVKDWLVDCWLEIILEFYSQYPEWYRDLITMRFRMLFEEAVFTTGRDRREKQGFKGIMKSGCFLTIVLNSIGQLLLHYVVAHRLGLGKSSRPWCLGDDTVQNADFNIDAYVEQLKLLGFNPKVGTVDQHVEFIGFLMDSERVIPAYWKKHLFCLKYLKEEVAESALESYLMLYVDEPVMYEILRTSGGGR